MKRLAFATVMLVLIWHATPILPRHAGGYEAQTHQALSTSAFSASTIAGLLPSYGIDPGRAVRVRPQSIANGSRPPAIWVRDGGSDEDVPFYRVLNHFYDPEHDLPMDGGARAPDWALEPEGHLQPQEHSLRDARDAFYNGLTHPSRDVRERELGHTFHALGHVIHLIQDMAQPQHTRNDIHPPIWPWKSFTENYVEDNIQRFLPTLVATNNQIPRVSSALDLWVSDAEHGFAQFSNRNFVSAHTNFKELQQGAHAEKFTSPTLDLELKGVVPEGAACKDGASLAPAPITVYGNRIVDPVTGGVFLNERMTSHSIFDHRLKAKGKKLIFALNCFNVDAAADILLPRSVAYSAALLKHFFRGRVDAKVVDSRLRIKNATPDEAMTGTFEFFYDAIDGTRVRAASWTGAIGPDAEADAPMPVPLPARPPMERDRYLLVFRGQLGQEADAVAGRWVGLAPKPVILVHFGQENLWSWGWVPGQEDTWGRYAEGLRPEDIARMEHYRALGGSFNRMENVILRLYSVVVPEDPSKALQLTALPFDLIGRFEVTPAPVWPPDQGAFVNFLEPGGGGISVLDTDASWRVTVHWAPDAPLRYQLGPLLGYGPDGQVDLSPRVVKVCPGREWTHGLFAPLELQHPLLGHCPDWLTFGD